MHDGGERTRTSTFGVGRREGHDASAFYARFTPPTLSDDETVERSPDLLERLGTGLLVCGSSTDMALLPDNSVALVVTSPPYFVGKDYELAVTGGLDGGPDGGDRIPHTYAEFIGLLGEVFAECRRVLEPGGADRRQRRQPRPQALPQPVRRRDRVAPGPGSVAAGRGDLGEVLGVVGVVRVGLVRQSLQPGAAGRVRAGGHRLQGLVLPRRQRQGAPAPGGCRTSRR